MKHSCDDVSPVGVIGGTGLDKLPELELIETCRVSTPYGEPAAPVLIGRFRGQRVCFLPRHGNSHELAPHEINYRANVWALRSMGVNAVISCTAVGGIAENARTGSMVVPDNLIDYTWGRESTFHESPEVTHIDFTYPYSKCLRSLLLRAGNDVGRPLVDGGTYGATQGPRLETAAEIERLARDGCAVVGMTGMPEAALAREAGLDYATCALVVNPAAGRGDGRISMDEIARVLGSGMADVRLVLGRTLELMASVA